MAHPHQSVSSSVYSAVDSEHRFRVSHQPLNSRFGVLTEMDEPSADSASTVEMDTGASNQTAGTFVTASESVPSFTYVNNSLLRTESAEHEEPVADEETPQLSEEQAFSADTDRTPLIGAWPGYTYNGTPNNPYNVPHNDPSDSDRYGRAKNLVANNLPTGYRQDGGPNEAAVQGTGVNPEVASKFERLSITLLQNGLNMSEESQQFQLNFSLKVQRENSNRAKDKNSNVKYMGRTSSYYTKIQSMPKADPAGPEHRSLRRSSSSTSNSSTADSGYYDRTMDSSPVHHTTDIHSNASGASSVGAHDVALVQATGGLNIHYKDNQTATLAPKAQEGRLPEARHSVALSHDDTYDTQDVDHIDMSVLFIRALHSFDSTQSQLESDESTCLSFADRDLAFVHTIDDSGWGEVTLLETLERGWVPMNFFYVAVNGSLDSTSPTAAVLPYSHYMGALLDSCGKFLLNPISHPTRHGTKTFSVKTINSVRDGVRRLLQETDCMLRSNELVIKKPVVRKCRKSLLSDWYLLMVKAAEFKNTNNYDKIEILTLLVLQVTRRAATFFDVWAKESKDVIGRDTELSLRDDIQKYLLLKTPPNAKQRLAEISSVLYSYLCLVVGRLDLVEHNPAGCNLLETMVHHIILLLRELLFISKTGTDHTPEGYPESYPETAPGLDGSLDVLLSLVSQIVTGVKSLVINTLNEPQRQRSVSHKSHSHDQYSHTGEGKRLVLIAAKMIHAIAQTISCIRRTLEPLSDYKLSAERAYPDYSLMRIDPQEFIRVCSVGMVKSLSLNVKNLREMKKQNAAKRSNRSNRYSTFRLGKQGELGITTNGIDGLHKALLVDTETSVPFGAGIEFKQYLPTDNNQQSSSFASDAFTINDELLVDAQGNLLGASFKGLIYTLTNENSPPEYFFVSAFFICFRNFASGYDLAELLILRFECESANELNAQVMADVLRTVRLKNRQKIVCKLFRIWMESYWNHRNDHVYLTTLVNFFNEGVCRKLPFEGMKLVEIAARLVVQDKDSDQFLNRSISLAKIKRKSCILPRSDSDRSITARYSMIDGYELAKINTNSSVASSLKFMTLPLPLGISGQSTSTCSLLSKSQLHAIETLVTTFRHILLENWVPLLKLESKEFVIEDVGNLLPRWYALSDQDWVLSNYHPNLLDFNGLEVAKQFTLIESEIFCAIQESELVNSNFTAKRAHLNLAPNVRQSLLFTNCLSEYVVESVLQPQVSHRVRVDIIKTWLKIAISCLYLRNFNSLAAIITSLQSHLITRLRRLWLDLSEKYTELYDYLCSIIHPEKNYTVYRTKLKSFLHSNEFNVPVVPYFSLFLQDLTFVTDGNPNYRTANTFLKQKLINIDKYLQITRIIADIESLQISYVKDTEGVLAKRGSLFSMGLSKKMETSSLSGLEDYSIASVPALKELILLELWKVAQLNKREEDRAWKLSCVLQPRDTSQVQER